MPTRVLAFGTFDGVHEGHRNFFAQAREYGEELVVAVAPDAVAEQLKGKRPRHSEEERRTLVETEPLVDRAVLGDGELSSYEVIERVAPEALCVGYDQEELERDLRAHAGKIPIHRLKPYRPETYHSSRGF